jgi:hypothetical protein
MKYFTPDLIKRMNAADIKIVMSALEDWEVRVSAYDRRLQQIWTTLPRSVRHYLGHCRLHDAEFCGAIQAPPDGSRLSLLARHGDRLVSLHYELVGRPVIETVLPAHGVSLWRYDEVDIMPRGVLVHRILLTSGEELTVRFRKFRVVEGSWLLPAENGKKAPMTRKKAVPA